MAKSVVTGWPHWMGELLEFLQQDRAVSDRWRGLLNQALGGDGSAHTPKLLLTPCRSGKVSRRIVRWTTPALYGALVYVKMPLRLSVEAPIRLFVFGVLRTGKRVQSWSILPTSTQLLCAKMVQSCFQAAATPSYACGTPGLVVS